MSVEGIDGPSVVSFEWALLLCLRLFLGLPGCLLECLTCLGSGLIYLKLLSSFAFLALFEQKSFSFLVKQLFIPLPERSKCVEQLVQVIVVLLHQDLDLFFSSSF